MIFLITEANTWKYCLLTPFWLSISFLLGQ